MSERAPALPFLALAAAVVAGHLSLYPRVADLDGFYHVGHALAYLEGSPLDTSLPWATQSIIGDLGGDLWWGFHVLLMPLAALAGVEWGVRIAGLLLTAVLGASVLWVLRRHAIPGAGWWSALFLIAVPNVFYRHLMVRPHVLSLAASLALLSVLVRGRWWQVVALSAGIAWVHLSLFWIAPAIAVVYALARIVVTVGAPPVADGEGVPPFAAVASAVGGAALGWAARPDAVAALSLLNIQLVELFAVKALDLPLSFAAELQPYGLLELLQSSWSFALLWLVAGCAVLARTISGETGATASASDGDTASGAGEPSSAAGSRSFSPQREETPPFRREVATLVVASAILSTVFLSLTLTSARRAMEQWVGFGFLLVPLAGTVFAHRRPGRSKAASEGFVREDGARPRPFPDDAKLRLVRGAAALLLVAHLGWGAWRHSLNVSVVAFRGDTLREVAEFLAASSDPGEIVFHARWDNFGPLFAHNRANRYLGGMDPIFFYAHDPASYWEFFFLSADATQEYTCDAYPCAEGTATDTHRVLMDHFGTRWVVVEPYRNPRLSLYLLNDDRYGLALETQHAAVFEVLEVRAADAEAR